MASTQVVGWPRPSAPSGRPPRSTAHPGGRRRGGAAGTSGTTSWSASSSSTAASSRASRSPSAGSRRRVHAVAGIVAHHDPGLGGLVPVLPAPMGLVPLRARHRRFAGTAVRSRSSTGSRVPVSSIMLTPMPVLVENGLLLPLVASGSTRQPRRRRRRSTPGGSSQRSQRPGPRPTAHWWTEARARTVPPPRWSTVVDELVTDPRRRAQAMRAFTLLTSVSSNSCPDIDGSVPPTVR